MKKGFKFTPTGKNRTKKKYVNKFVKLMENRIISRLNSDNIMYSAAIWKFTIHSRSDIKKPIIIKTQMLTTLHKYLEELDFEKDVIYIELRIRVFTTHDQLCVIQSLTNEFTVI